jgi:hypothetical protein
MNVLFCSKFSIFIAGWKALPIEIYIAVTRFSGQPDNDFLLFEFFSLCFGINRL